MYANVALVRELSGLQNTAKISNVRIVGKLTVAESMIDGALAYRYTLPLTAHRSNTLVFSGTGSGTGTLAIVINGTTYTLNVTLALTASDLADVFREAVEGSTDFITDIVGSGATVTLISYSTSVTEANAQVNITSAADGNGITTTIGSRQDRYPPSLSYLSADIATALLLQEEYGVEAEGTSRDGFSRMKALLMQLESLQGIKTPVMRIVDEVTKQELPQDTKDNIRFYPTTASRTNADNTASKITINKQF